MKIHKLLTILLCMFAFAKAYAQQQTQTRRVSDDGVGSQTTHKVSDEYLDQLKKKFENMEVSQSQKIGTSLGDFTLVDMEGVTITSQDLKGKVSVINFWYKECKPCIKEMPELNELVAQYASDDEQFIAFSTTSVSKLKGFFDKHPFAYRQIAGARKYASDQDIMMFPTNIILDKKGKVTYISSGYGGEIADTLEIEINKNLK